MHSYTLDGIIINRTNIGEADKIITLYSLQFGKISLKAKGIRKLSSRRAGSLELFNWVKVSVVTGRGNLDVITEVDVVDTFADWKKHLGRVNIAYQMAEIIDKLTPDRQPQPHIYKILLNSYSAIGQLAGSWQSETENWFLSILSELGYWPHGQKFSGNIFSLIEELSDRPLHAHKVLPKLR
jgi:DNA repair protein RecO (recombination protein O)